MIRARIKEKRESVKQGAIKGFHDGATAGFKEGASNGFKEGAQEGFREGASEGFKQGAREGFKENGVKGAIKGGTKSAVHGGMQGAITGSVKGAVHGGLHGAIEGGINGAVDGALTNLFDEQPTPQSPQQVISPTERASPTRVEANQQFFSPPKITRPTLDALKLTTNKLEYLNQYYGKDQGWSLGATLVQSKNWTEVNDYLKILVTLNTDIHTRSQYLRHANFLKYIATSDVDRSVIFNLLNNFIVTTPLIEQIALITNLKKQIIAYVVYLFNETEDEQLTIWKKCINKNEPLGKFFWKNRNPFTTKTPHSVDIISNKITSLENKLVQNEHLTTTLTQSMPTTSIYPAPISNNYEPFFQREPHQETPAQSINQEVILNKTLSFPLLYLLIAGAALVLVLYALNRSEENENNYSERPGFR